MKSTFSHYSQLPRKSPYYWLNPCWIEISSNDTIQRCKWRANSIELRNLLFSQQRSCKSIKIQNQGKKETVPQESLSMSMKLLLVIFRLVNLKKKTYSLTPLPSFSDSFFGDENASFWFGGASEGDFFMLFSARGRAISPPESTTCDWTFGGSRGPSGVSSFSWFPLSLSWSVCNSAASVFSWSFKSQSAGHSRDFEICGLWYGTLLLEMNFGSLVIPEKKPY